jgi:hypothetical protein
MSSGLKKAFSPSSIPLHFIIILAIFYSTFCDHSFNFSVMTVKIHTLILRNK